MDWIKTIEHLGSVTSITLLIGYLGKKYIDFISKKNIDKGKHILNNETERLKHELSNRANEINSLHTERLQVIKQLYGLLTLFNDRLRILVISGKGDESEINQIEELYSEYYNLKLYFIQNRILINKELSILINDLISKLHSALSSFKRVIYTNSNIQKNIEFELKDNCNYKIKRDYWDKSARLVEDETPLILEKLESEFRKLIGVINKKQ